QNSVCLKESKRITKTDFKLLILHMPSRFISYLKVTFGSMVVLYLALMTVTMYFASTQNDLLNTMSDREAATGVLETRYYAAVDTLNATNPTSLGFVSPAHVTYMHAPAFPTLTRAGN